MDISAEKIIFGVAGIDPQRRDELIKVLDIDISWRLHKVSDGQRRRVQICVGLLKPLKVYVANGKLQLALPLEKVKETSKKSLMRTVVGWLRKERDEERKKRKERKANGLPEFESRAEESLVTGDPARMLNNGWAWAAGRLQSMGGEFLSKAQTEF